jgi:hypothetical protein
VFPPTSDAVVVHENVWFVVYSVMGAHWLFVAGPLIQNLYHIPPGIPPVVSAVRVIVVPAFWGPDGFAVRDWNWGGSSATAPEIAMAPRTRKVKTNRDRLLQ